MKKVLIIIITTYYFYSCDTNVEITSVEPNKVTELDSAYTICKNLYFWNENLPSSIIFKPILQKDINGVLEHIRDFSDIHNGKHIDQWSFAMNKASWDAIEKNETTGFGFDVAFWQDDDLRISQVYKSSDSFEKGLKRGTKIISINDIKAELSQKELLVKALKGSKITITFLANDEQIHKTTILSTNFIKKSIMSSKMIDNDIAYLVLDIFEGESTIKELNDVFVFFTKNKAKELIIDLRYNHGGNGNIALALANLIAPKESEGKVFTRIINNQRNRIFNYSLFFKPNISNNLGTKRVFFITSDETASASEALINSLDAIMDVKLIGSQTHGKPFGFFPIPIDDNYIFPIAFKSVNADGYGDYYDGLPVDIKVKDDLTHDFGDVEESCLKTVLHYIKTDRKLQINNDIKILYLKNEKPDLFHFTYSK